MIQGLFVDTAQPGPASLAGPGSSLPHGPTAVSFSPCSNEGSEDGKREQREADRYLNRMRLGLFKLYFSIWIKYDGGD